MERVMIVGAPGSGKSTLARWLGAQTGLPVVHMDHLHWKSGWVPRPDAEKAPMVAAVEVRPAWIFEGGHSTTYDNRVARADTVIWLDLPVGLRLWRVTKRLVLQYGQRRPDMAEGCVETLGAHTWEFYRYIWQTRHSARSRVLRLLAPPPAHVQLVHLTSPGQVRRFMAGFERAGTTALEDVT